MSHPIPEGAELAARIPERWRAATLEAARRLGEAGHRAWVVGGGVRDLVLGRPMKDIDLVSAALPDEVEGLFEKTIAVGKSFGIVVAVIDGLELEVATFRKERGYSDRRRPDEIEFADTPEVDAQRRDFTCNALFLDPLNGELCDPTGGLDDLARRELRAVGDAGARFREDGLRLLRMARFLAVLELEPVAGLLDAARAEQESIVGVSPERVWDELGKMLASDHAPRALRLMHEVEVAERCLPGWTHETAAEKLAQLDALESANATVALALLFGPEASDAAEHLDALRSSKEVKQSVVRTIEVAGRLVREADTDVGDDEHEMIGRRLETWRSPERANAQVLVECWHRGDPPARSVAHFESMRRLDERTPATIELPSPAELMARGLPAGPALGEALRRATHAALGGAFSGKGAAMQWIAANGLLDDARPK